MKSIFAADWTFWRLLLRFKYFKSILLPICPRFISSLPEDFLLLAIEVAAMKGTVIEAFVEAYSRNMVVSFNSVVFLVLAALGRSQGEDVRVRWDNFNRAVNYPASDRIREMRIRRCFMITFTGRETLLVSRAWVKLMGSDFDESIDETKGLMCIIRVLSLVHNLWKCSFLIFKIVISRLVSSLPSLPGPPSMASQRQRWQSRRSPRSSTRPIARERWGKSKSLPVLSMRTWVAEIAIYLSQWITLC